MRCLSYLKVQNSTWKTVRTTRSSFSPGCTNMASVKESIDNIITTNLTFEVHQRDLECITVYLNRLRDLCLSPHFVFLSSSETVAHCSQVKPQSQNAEQSDCIGVHDENITGIITMVWQCRGHLIDPESITGIFIKQESQGKEESWSRSWRVLNH